MFDFQEIPPRVGKIPTPINPENGPITYWIEMIHDLVFGAGYSYSRIAYRTHVSPSTIQKLVANPNRKPRLKLLHPLFSLHHKVFQGQYATPRAREYWEIKMGKKTTHLQDFFEEPNVENIFFKETFG